MWNLTGLFTSDTDSEIAHAEQAAQTATTAFSKKWSDRTDYHTDPNVLHIALKEYEQLLANNGLLARNWGYWHLRSEQNQNDTAVKAKLLSTQELSEKLANSVRFFTLAIQKIAPDKQAPFLQNPQLKPYRHWLERQFAAGPHMLSEAEENILALKASTSYTQWVQLTEECLAKEERDGKPLAVLSNLCSDHRQSVRDRAAKHINEIVGAYVPIATAELNAILAHKKTEDELRGFTRPDASRHLDDDIESDVVDAMIMAVSKRQAISHRYYALKATIWGKKRLHYHERNITVPTAEAKLSYTKSLDLVEATFRELHPDFGDKVRAFDTEGRIDVFPRQGKSGGAFCSYVAAKLPVYVLLNHTDRLRDALVIAHELGHGLNGEYMSVESELNYGGPTSTAEVASTFFEDFVLQKLLAEADDETKLSLLMQQVTDEVSTIFRQVALYRFEQALHTTFRKDGYLDATTISTLFTKELQAYLGSAVEMTPGCETRWTDWPHIRYFFYVYSYASGLLISKALQASVRRDPRFIEQVKVFLSSGSSRSPYALFKELGLDIKQADFWNTGLDEIEQHLDEVTKLARKLGKI